MNNKPTIKLEVKSFAVPDNAILVMPPYIQPPIDGGGGRCNIEIPLKEIDEADLSVLCNQFRAEVFKKANKTDPHKTNYRQA